MKREYSLPCSQQPTSGSCPKSDETFPPTVFFQTHFNILLPFMSVSIRSVVPSSLMRNVVESSWNVMAHDYARVGKWRGNWRMEWVASTLHTSSEHGVSSITTADAHTSAVSSRLNWFRWTRPFLRKTKSGFCACAITFRTQSTCDHQNTLRCHSYRVKTVTLHFVGRKEVTLTRSKKYNTF